MWDSLCLVLLSRSGLTEEQLRGLLEDLGHEGTMQVLPLEWARFRSVTMPWVQEKPSGSLSFTHQSLTQAIELLLMRVRPGRGPGGLRRTRRTYQLTLAQYFQKQGRELSSWGKALEEVPWLLEQCEAWGQLHAFLTDPQTVEHLSSNCSQSPQLRLDIVRLWKILTLKGYDPYTSYQSLLGNEVHGPPSEQKDRHSTAVFMTEALNRDEADPVCLFDWRVRGRVAVLVSELLLSLGREREAEELLLQALDHLSQAGAEDTESALLLLDVRRAAAGLCVVLGRPPDAETHLTSALRTTEALLSSSSQEPGGLAVWTVILTGQLLCALCQLRFAEGRAEDATQILSDIISIGHHSVHPCAKATVISLDDPMKAEGHLQAALEARRNWYGGEHPLVVEVEEHLANIWAESSFHAG